MQYLTSENVITLAATEISAVGDVAQPSITYGTLWLGIHKSLIYGRVCGGPTFVAIVAKRDFVSCAVDFYRGYARCGTTVAIVAEFS